MFSVSAPWTLVLLWFVIYWILGGVFFSLIAATRLMSLRKARFSCLFTFGSILAAYAASVGAVMLSHPGKAPECSARAIAENSGIGNLLTCNFPAVLAAGGICFAFLMMGGLIAMIFSRTGKAK